jgi:hypothetical protein
LNNKNESSYYKVFESFKSIITLEGVNELELISYSTDYEIAFFNALERLFPQNKALSMLFSLFL